MSSIIFTTKCVVNEHYCLLKGRAYAVGDVFPRNDFDGQNHRPYELTEQDCAAMVGAGAGIFIEQKCDHTMEEWHDKKRPLRPTEIRIPEKVSLRADYAKQVSKDEAFLAEAAAKKLDISSTDSKIEKLINSLQAALAGTAQRA